MLAETEKIEALIHHLENLKEATFIRNGSDYGPKAAAKFLRGKWDKKQIKSAQDFIEKVATASSTSGKPYLIRFKDGRELKCGEYLKQELKRLENKPAKYTVDDARCPIDARRRATYLGTGTTEFQKSTLYSLEKIRHSATQLQVSPQPTQTVRPRAGHLTVRRFLALSTIEAKPSNHPVKYKHNIVAFVLATTLLASCCCAFQVWSAEDEPVLTDAAVRDIGQTYGFHLGQSFSLDAIEQKFADLAPQARIARLQFDSSFASSITNMDAVLTRKGGEWPKVKTELREKIAATLGSQTLTPDSAKSFVETVSKRAKGEIPSPVIETLLTFHPSYIAKPGSEFLDGFKARFTSDGSGKAKGVRFHLDYPKSWSSADGNRPNIVRKFVSQNGRGFEMIMVMVKSLPLPPGQKLTDKDIEKMVAEVATPKELKEMLPDGASFVSGGPLRLDGRPGFYQKYSLKQQRLDFTLSSLAVSYTVYYQTSMIQIQCHVGSEAKEEQGLKQRFERFEPLFKLVANSFVIESQWK